MPWVFVPAAVALYLAANFVELTWAVKDPRSRVDFLTGDAKPYLAVARQLIDSGFSMDYVKGRPQRQPLYPAVLSGVLHWKGPDDFFWLAVPNVAFATLGFLVAYFALLYFHGRYVAAVAGLLYLVNPFLFVQTTNRFMTEPLHILLMCVVIFAFLAYLKEGRPWQLLVAAAATGADYLARANGLFVMLSLAGALALWEAGRWIESRSLPPRRELLRRAALYAAAALVFVAVSTPSWQPRLRLFGNPIYHGYLTNYLWVDTYEQGHTDEKKYGWRDYVATHSAGDAVKRGLSGAWNVGFAIPFRREEPLPALYLLALGGVLLAAARGPASYRAMAVFGIVQLLPLMWTNMSNPNYRVPYGATFPFEVVFAGFCLAFLFERFGTAAAPWRRETPEIAAR